MNTFVMWFLSLNPLIGISLLATVLSFLFALIYRAVMDVEKIKKIKKESKEFKKRMDEARKKGDHKELKDLWEKSMKLTQEQFALTMKPLMLTFALVIVVFPLMKKLYSGVVFDLPFPLPFIGSQIGWLGLYIIISIPTSTLFRKLLGVD